MGDLGLEQEVREVAEGELTPEEVERRLAVAISRTKEIANLILEGYPLRQRQISRHLEEFRLVIARGENSPEAYFIRKILGHYGENYQRFLIKNGEYQRGEIDELTYINAVERFVLEMEIADCR